MKSHKMKSYLSLIPIAAKTRRKQNRLILLCIIFSVFLVTTVFSFAEILTKSETEAMVKKHGSHHLIVSGLSEAEAEEIAAMESVSASAWYRVFGEDIYEGYQIGGVRAILYGTQQPYIAAIREYAWEGMYPQNGQEIMLNESAKERLSVRMGDSLTLHTPAADFTYTVTGFCVDERQEYDDKYDGVCAYLTLSALDAVCAANGADEAETERAAYYVRFAKGTKLRETIAELKAQYGLQDGDIEENLITMGAAGASSSRTMNGLYATAAVVFVMILIAGVLMISSCMNSMVSQRTKFFGMLRCIGAGRDQVMRFVRLEALYWCKTAIPVGLGVSIVFTWVLCLFLKYKVGGEFQDASFRLSAAGVVSGILVGVLSVLLSAYAPAKRAAAVSPVAAVSGNSETGKAVSHVASRRLLRVERALGVHHATASKKNLLLMSMSFAFTVALFLVFFAGLDLAKKLLPSESDLSPDISIAAIDDANSIDRGVKEEIGRLAGVETVFGASMQLAVPAQINGSPASVDLISYDAYLFDWSQRSVVSGRLAAVSGDTNEVMTIFNMDSRLNTGDQIQIGDTVLHIACVVSEGIGTENRPAIVCTEETFRRLTGEQQYILLGVQLAKDAPEDTVASIQAIAGANDLADRREENQTSHASFWVFRFAAYGFLGIIALITIFNIMNNISMSVTARMKQYGAMRAVGMSAGQMAQMVAAEAITYAACGLAAGCIAGLYLHRLIMVKIVFTHFGGVWTLPVKPLFIITGIVACSCVLAVHMPVKRIREMAVTETIGEL